MLTRLLCDEIRPMLGALADDELSGADMLRATAHLEQCSACAHEHAALQRVGDMLREAAASGSVPAMAGLADGIVTRVRAEADESWRGIYHRAVDSWHWAIVGLGSVAGSALVTLLAGAVLLFGPPPERSDSLAGVYTKAGLNETEVVLIDVVNGREVRGDHYGDVLAGFVGPSERDMVGWLADALSRPGAADLSRMAEADRRYVEALGDSIGFRRTYARQLRLRTSTTVSASSP